MDAIQQHFDDEAPDFDRIIVTLIPEYRRMVDTLVRAIPFPPTAAIRVLDLGCGTGTVARALADAFPNAHLTCVDLAASMIAIARTKLASHPHVHYVVADFYTLKVDGPFDVVVSSLALHHLVSDDDKRWFFRRIYDWLAQSGAFYNADIVLASNEFLQDFYMEQWRAFMSQSVSSQEIDGKWMPQYLAEDRPSPLVDQLLWLGQSGFRDVDVLWKYFNFAVYGGIKRTPD
jgi:tRNA (cmo5U34)-methyltransferase